LPAKIASLPPGRYRVLYADPPWRYNDSRSTGDHWQSTGAVDHYADLDLDSLKRLDVAAIAAPDSVLFCWATVPLIEDGLALVSAWGFKYKTAFVWDKGHGSFGHYHDAEAELLLVATRGSCLPEPVAKEKQVQRFARRRTHSAKPEEWRALIDRLYPSGPRIELFQRGAAPDNWTVWGAEADAA
jgi:N6-adenosine-specific RNA methylase IME4